MGQYHRFVRLDDPEDGKSRLSTRDGGVNMTEMIGSTFLTAVVAALNADAETGGPSFGVPQEGAWAGAPVMLAGDYGEANDRGHYSGPSHLTAPDKNAYEGASVTEPLFADEDLDALHHADPHGPEMVIAADLVPGFMDLVVSGEVDRAWAWVQDLMEGVLRDPREE